MKKFFFTLCAGFMAVAMTACGGNKSADDNAAADSDSIVVEETVDTVVADTMTVPAEEVEAPAEKNTSKKTSTKTEVKKEVNNAANTADKAVNDALKKAADKTKQVAEQGVDDAEAKARAWKEKQIGRAHV